MTSTPSRSNRRRKVAGILVLAILFVAGAIYAGPKVWRHLTGANLHQVWVVKRHQEVERYGEGLKVLREMRMEVPPEEHRIGTLVADLDLHPLDGPATSLEALTTEGPVVLAHRAPGKLRNEDRGKVLADLEKRYGASGVRFVYFYTGADVSADAARADLAASGLEGSAVLDPDGLVARDLGVLSTSDVFLVDAGRTLVYRGAVDDARVSGDGTIGPAHRNFLADAIDETLRHRPVTESATRGLGAALAFDQPPDQEGVTQAGWNDRIQRIFQYRCQRCHNDDGSAPFPLTTYTDVRGRRGTIRLVLEAKSMPPWMVEEGLGPWRNSLALPDAEREDLIAWIDADCPKGDPRDAPVDLEWPGWDEWLIGKPDMIIQPAEPTHLPAEGIVSLVKTRVVVNFPEDRWVQAIQLLPSVKGVLHHATIFIEPPKGQLLFLDALLPGKGPTVYPQGQARFISKGSNFRFIIHYTPNGKECDDLLRLGLKFTDEPPFREIHSIWMTNNDFVIPAHDPNYQVSTEFVLPRDVLLKQFMPHMHLRGKEFLAEAIKPDGTHQKLLFLPRWTLDWQFAYELLDPIPLPKGSTIRCTGTYDNSADNPDNPNPDRDVPFGQQTFDEMLGFGMDFVDK